MDSLPIIITESGPLPRDPTEIRETLVTDVTRTNPGFTANLPSSLVEDVVSTSIAGLAVIDQARVDLINSLTPFGANDFLLNQLGNMFGVPAWQDSNTAVYVQFRGTPGFPIGPGFTVSDGVHQYVILDGGRVGADGGDGNGISPLLFAVSPDSGSWAIPRGTVQGIITSVPSTVTLTVNNPSAGTPATSAPTAAQHRASILQAGLAACSGLTTMLKTALRRVEGVQQRLISVVQEPNNGGWKIIVGGGDPYQVADAILSSGIDISSLVGSTLSISNATQSNPCVITTDKGHGFVTGQVIGISSAQGMTQLNALTPTITVIDGMTFSLNGVNSTGWPAYTGGGVITPNVRNIVVSVNDYPDTYTIPFVNPPQQSAVVTITWNTSSPNFVSDSAVEQLAQPKIAAYINSIVSGQPINVSQINSIFKDSVSSILDPNLITRIVVNVTIDGVPASPIAGTFIIPGDPEGYFYATDQSVSVNKG